MAEMTGPQLAAFAAELRKWWSFDDRQFHTHSWHMREDFIKEKLPELLAASRLESSLSTSAQGEISEATVEAALSKYIAMEICGLAPVECMRAALETAIGGKKGYPND